jgi:hypothetical protein
VPALAAMLATFGCSPACQAGIVATIEPESGLDPSAQGWFGAGLPQWTGPRRHHAAAECGFVPNAGACQVALIVRELGEFGIRDRLFSMTDPGEAAEFFYRHFEMPGARIPERRVERAQHIYNELNVGDPP